MLLIFGTLITLTAAVTLSRVWVAGAMHGAPIGWMSERWLAEHRASHPS